MKITKSQLKRIIKEEIQNVLNEIAPPFPEDDPGGYAYPPGSIMDPEVGEYEDEEGEVRAGPEPEWEDPDSDADDAEELAAGLDLTGFEIKRIRTGYLIVDKESGEAVLGPFQLEDEALETLKTTERNPDYRP